MNVKNVLIVEDDPILLFVNEKLITNLGHTIAGTARTGPEAIDKAKSCNPDIILIDIRLLGPMDGIEAVCEIRKFSNVPIVFVSGNSDPKTFERAKETEIKAFLTKPVSLEMLKEILD